MIFEKGYKEAVLRVLIPGKFTGPINRIAVIHPQQHRQSGDLAALSRQTQGPTRKSIIQYDADRRTGQWQ